MCFELNYLYFYIVVITLTNATNFNSEAIKAKIKLITCFKTPNVKKAQL
jgi:hypothetical protein